MKNTLKLFKMTAIETFKDRENRGNAMIIALSSAGSMMVLDGGKLGIAPIALDVLGGLLCGVLDYSFVSFMRYRRLRARAAPANG